MPAGTRDGDIRDRGRRAVRTAGADRRVRLPLGGAWQRSGAVDRGRHCGRHRGDREMACGWSYSGRRASAVVSVRVAQRGIGHLRRDGRRAVVRPSGHRNACDEPVAPRSRGEDRPRRVVRDVLVTRGGPGDAAEGCHRQPRMRRADTPVPRPGDADGHRCPRRGFDVGSALRGAARGSPGCGRHRRPGVVGDARRRGSSVDTVAGQPDRAVECVPQEAR